MQESLVLHCSLWNNPSNSVFLVMLHGGIHKIQSLVLLLEVFVNLQVPLHVDTRLTTEAVKSKHHDQHGKRIDLLGHAV